MIRSRFGVSDPHGIRGARSESSRLDILYTVNENTLRRSVWASTGNGRQRQIQMIRQYSGVAYVNGEFVPAEEASVSVFDHGLLYGDGVFDTLFAKYGLIFKLDEHLARFGRSLRGVSLELPISLASLRDVVIETAARNDLQDAYIKVVVTRGRGPEPLLDPRGCTPSLIVFVRPYLSLADPATRKAGVRGKLTSIRRVQAESLDPRIKSLNYLNFVLAKMEALSAGADEALMLDEKGFVCEAPGYNLFVVRDGELATPDQSILEGITRQTVIELSDAMDVRCSVKGLRPFDLTTADEAFLTSTAAGFVALTSVDGRPIGDGIPGPVLARFDQAYDQLLRSGRHGTRIPTSTSTPDRTPAGAQSQRSAPDAGRDVGAMTQGPRRVVKGG